MIKDQNIENSLNNVFKNLQIFPVLVPVLLPVTQICLTGSLYTVLAVAIERFLAVTRYLLLPFVRNILLPGNFVNRNFCHQEIFFTRYFFQQLLLLPGIFFTMYFVPRYFWYEVLFSPGIFCTRHQILFRTEAPYLIQKLPIRGILFSAVNICHRYLSVERKRFISER